jgi:hypothetical protein
MTDVEPTPEDYETARKALERDPRETWLEIEARLAARRRLERERIERRRRLVRRLLFRRAA